MQKLCYYETRSIANNSQVFYNIQLRRSSNIKYICIEPYSGPYLQIQKLWAGIHNSDVTGLVKCIISEYIAATAINIKLHYMMDIMIEDGNLTWSVYHTRGANTNMSITIFYEVE